MSQKAQGYMILASSPCSHWSAMKTSPPPPPPFLKAVLPVSDHPKLHLGCGIPSYEKSRRKPLILPHLSSDSLGTVKKEVELGLVAETVRWKEGSGEKAAGSTSHSLIHSDHPACWLEYTAGAACSISCLAHREGGRSGQGTGVGVPCAECGLGSLVLLLL